MFPRGPRFEPEKISDVPGPNAYNIDQDSNLEAYKRGAFLEKTDRFMKQKPSETPGPGAYSTDTKKSVSKSSSQNAKPPAPPDSGARYATLQRKVEELEKIHNEGKKTHSAELEHMRLELARTQKANVELIDRAEKQKKQQVALELRIEELKKNALSDKAEIKDLAMKLRMSERQRTQFTAKQGEVGDLKKAVQALETKRREEVAEKNKVIAELEQNLAAEKELIEGQLKELKGKHEAEIRGTRDSIEALKAELVTARDETQEARSCLEGVREEAKSQDEILKKQLEDHRVVLCNVAKQYGELSATVVSKVAYDALKSENVALQLQATRATRKIANSEAQVVELANLIRQSQDDNRLLRGCLQQLEEELRFYSDICMDGQYMYQPANSSSSLDGLIADMDQDLQHFEREFVQCNSRTLELEVQYYRLKHEELLAAYADANDELQEAQVRIDAHTAELADAVQVSDDLSSHSHKVEKERDLAQELLEATTKTVDDLKVSSERLKQQVTEIETKLSTERQMAEVALKKEQDTVQRLRTTIQKARMAEDELRAEIGQLTAELAEAERFQEAYYSLFDEVESLLARSALAEDEARKLSAFNAEILGHHNPAQRIMYVERIRQELAETKHKLLASTKAHEAVNALNQDLQNELDMYKSVTVPELRPKTNMTRLTRPPLIALNKSGAPANHHVEEKVKPVRTFDTVTGDMILDEIM